MAKKLPKDEFKSALTALNEVLKESGDTQIKFVGVKKNEVVENFTKKVIEFIEQEKIEKLPDEVINFYNDHIANEEPDDDDKEEKTTKKPKKEKKPKKPKKSWFIPSESGGRPKNVIDALKEGGTQKDIIQKADDLCVKAGGTSNLGQTKRLFENAVRYLFYAGNINISEDGKYSVK